MITSQYAMENRIADLRTWAKSRIEVCRAQENKFTEAWSLKGHGPPQSLVEAWTERRALEEVLRMLDGNDEAPWRHRIRSSE